MTFVLDALPKLINEAPVVEVHLAQNTGLPGGMGEYGVSAMVSAIANAVFAANGKRLRKLPIDPNLLEA